MLMLMMMLLIDHQPVAQANFDIFIFDKLLTIKLKQQMLAMDLVELQNTCDGRGATV